MYVPLALQILAHSTGGMRKFPTSSCMFLHFFGRSEFSLVQGSRKETGPKFLLKASTDNQCSLNGDIGARSSPDNRSSLVLPGRMEGSTVPRYLVMLQTSGLVLLQKGLILQLVIVGFRTRNRSPTRDISCEAP